jgi:hypothetical protein
MQAAKQSPAKTPPARRVPGLKDKEPLQVRIPVTIKRQFKSHAALKGIEPHELFVEMWSFYEASLKSKATTGEGS